MNDGPSITIDWYGATHRLTADGWVSVPACNVRSADGVPCACDEGHGEGHSWERPAPELFGPGGG